MLFLSLYKVHHEQTYRGQKYIEGLEEVREDEVLEISYDVLCHGYQLSGVPKILRVHKLCGLLKFQ